MSILEPYKIDLKGLDDGQHLFEFHLTDAFFEAVDAQETRRGDVDVTLTVKRSTDIFTLDFHVDGAVVVTCDRCLDNMEQPIQTDSRLTVKFGTEYSEDGDLITVDENDGVLDTSWLVYEIVALAIPIKHVHAPGKCNVAMREKFEELSAARSSDGVETAVDPRWKILESLKGQEN